MSPLAEFLLFLFLLVAGIILFISVFRVHPAITLGIAALVSGLVLGLPFTGILTQMLAGITGILTGIGVVIALGAILGRLMESSGALEVLTGRILQWFGPKNPLTALSVLGLVVGIPVFCDSGFIILGSTAKKIEHQFRIKHGVSAVALAGGLYTAHTLVPPTPGPVAAAGNLGMGGQLGLVIISGLLISIVITAVLILCCRYLFGGGSNESIGTAEKSHHRLSLLWPILLALLIIAAGSVLVLVITPVPVWVAVITYPVTALSAACLVAYLQIPAESRKPVLLKDGLLNAVPIIIITAMGGAFGAVLKESSMASILEETFAGAGGGPLVLLVMSYLVAVILKTAQGSSTASLVITSSIMFPLVVSAALSPWQTALMVGAIGSGAMAVSHANDSFFWVVTRFSGMSVREGYLRFSLTTFILSLSGLAAASLLMLI